MFKLSHHVTAVVVTLLCVVHSTLQRSRPNSTDYVAAIVEYHPDKSVDATTTFFKNVHRYIRLIEKAANSTNNADIIVFPEGGLTTLGYKAPTLVPLASENIVPCTDTSGLYENLRLLSCAARDNQIYVVVNLSERFYCPKGTQSEYNEPCPESELLDYNCNVVFDRNGTVIAKYRKFHLFGKEMSTVSPPVADLVTFDTDFGVTFGMFICFDILFEKPATQLVKTKNIADIIFPSAWFSELPFVTAVQFQASWSYSMDVNFLAPGYNTPAIGSGGSGIYEGRKGSVMTIMPFENTTQLLIHSVQKKNMKKPKSLTKNQIEVEENPLSTTINAKSKLVSKSPNNKSLDGMRVNTENLSVYTTQLLERSTEEIRLCNNEFCCSFEVTGSISSDHDAGVRYYNRVVVFDGVRSVHGHTTIGTQVCGVVSCTSEELSSCGTVLNILPTTFTSIRIRGDFSSGSAMQFPNTLLYNYDVLSVNDFSFQQVVVDDKVECEVVLLKEASLLTFGIFGRKYSRDGEPVTTTSPSSGISLAPFFSLSIILIGIVSNLR